MNKRRHKTRLNPRGLARLLVSTTIIAFLTLGSRWWWWGGYLGLVLVMMTVSRHSRPQTAWLAFWGLLGLALVHVHAIPGVAGAILVIATALLFLASFAVSSQKDPINTSSTVPGPRWRGRPPMVPNADIPSDRKFLGF